jgi:hypothetical protein
MHVIITLHDHGWKACMRDYGRLRLLPPPPGEGRHMGAGLLCIYLLNWLDCCLCAPSFQVNFGTAVQRAGLLYLSSVAGPGPIFLHSTSYIVWAGGRGCSRPL